METFTKDCLKIHGIIETDSESNSGKSDFDDDYYRLKPPPIENVRNRRIINIGELNEQLGRENSNNALCGSNLSTANNLPNTDVLRNSSSNESSQTNRKKKRSRNEKKRCAQSNYKSDVLTTSSNKSNDVGGVDDIVDMRVISKSLSNKIDAKSFNKPEIKMSNKSKKVSSIDGIVDVDLLSKSSHNPKSKSFNKPGVVDVSNKSIDNIVDISVLSKSSNKTEAKSFNKPIVGVYNSNNRPTQDFAYDSINRKLICETKKNVGNGGHSLDRVSSVRSSEMLKQNMCIDNKERVGTSISANTKPTQSIAYSSRQQQVCRVTDMGTSYEIIQQRQSERDLSYNERLQRNIYSDRAQKLRGVRGNTYQGKIPKVRNVAIKNISHYERLEQIAICNYAQRLVEFVGVDTTYNRVIYVYKERTENSIRYVRNDYDEVRDENICSGVFYALLFSAIHGVLLECFCSIL